MIVCSDGLCGNVQRGAGGGLTNDQIAQLATEVSVRMELALFSDRQVVTTACRIHLNRQPDHCVSVRYTIRRKTAPTL